MPEKISVVIPCYCVAAQILDVLGKIGPDVDAIYVVDDACPQGTASLVQEKCEDARVIILSHETNLGVGGATITGYRRAISDGADIIVKLDGDGQMELVGQNKFEASNPAKNYFTIQVVELTTKKVKTKFVSY